MGHLNCRELSCEKIERKAGNEKENTENTGIASAFDNRFLKLGDGISEGILCF